MCREHRGVGCPWLHKLLGSVLQTAVWTRAHLLGCVPGWSCWTRPGVWRTAREGPPRVSQGSCTIGVAPCVRGPSPTALPTLAVIFEPVGVLWPLAQGWFPRGVCSGSLGAVSCRECQKHMAVLRWSEVTLLRRLAPAEDLRPPSPCADERLPLRLLLHCTDARSSFHSTHWT